MKPTLLSRSLAAVLFITGALTPTVASESTPTDSPLNAVLAATALPTTVLGDVTLKGPLTQGALVLGKTKPGSKVYLNNKAVKVSADGLFVLGFGRNDYAKQKIKTVDNHGQTTEQKFELGQRQYQVEDIKGIANKYVAPDPAVLDRIKADQQQVNAARSVMSERLDFLAEVLQPVEGRFSGFYGSQRILNGQPKNPHYGLDIAAPTGTPVKAPLNGKVVLVHNDMYYTGGTLIVEHGFGVTSTFIHLSEILVKVGDEIKQGDVIAKVGATGRVTGPHLDWRMNWKNVRLDPQLLLPKAVEASTSR